MNSWKDAIRELTRQPGRSLLTLLSVVVAVAAIVAVTSATATTRLAYKQVFQALVGRADVEVVAHGGGRFKQELAEPIRELPEVRTVVPIFHKATIIYTDSKKKAKVLAVGIVPDEPEAVSGFDIRGGRFPDSAEEIALEEGLAQGLEVKVGDSIRLLTNRRMQSWKVVGLFALENASRLHQGGMMLAPLDRLQRIFKATGQVDALHVFLKDSTQTARAIEKANTMLPNELRAQVPSARSGLAEETLLLTEVSLNMASALSFTTAVFIALSVFLMSVSERRRQLSIFRAVGATRRQVVGMVCREALLMGLAGTLVGIPMGVYGGSFLTRSVAVASRSAMSQARSKAGMSKNSEVVWICICPQPSVTVGIPCAVIQLASNPPLLTAGCGSSPAARTARVAATTEGSSLDN